MTVYRNLTDEPLTIAGVDLPRCPACDRPGLVLVREAGGDANANGVREWAVRHVLDGLPGPEPGVVLLADAHVAEQAAREGRDDVAHPLRQMFDRAFLGLAWFSVNTDTWTFVDAAEWDAGAVSEIEAKEMGE